MATLIDPTALQTAARHAPQPDTFAMLQSLESRALAIDHLIACYNAARGTLGSHAGALALLNGLKAQLLADAVPVLGTAAHTDFLAALDHAAAGLR